MLDSITIKNFKAIQDRGLPQEEISKINLVEVGEFGDDRRYYYGWGKKVYENRLFKLKKLKSVNYLTGRNECGKSSVLEYIYMDYNSKLILKHYQKRTNLFQKIFFQDYDIGLEFIKSKDLKLEDLKSYKPYNNLPKVLLFINKLQIDILHYKNIFSRLSSINLINPDGVEVIYRDFLNNCGTGFSFGGKDSINFVKPKTEIKDLRSFSRIESRFINSYLPGDLRPNVWGKKNQPVNKNQTPSWKLSHSQFVELMEIYMAKYLDIFSGSRLGR